MGKSNRHIPQRTCIACRRVTDKQNLIRLVRSADDQVSIDKSGRLPGRGADLCRDCLTGRNDLKNLEHALRMRLTASRKEQIIIDAREMLEMT